MEKISFHEAITNNYFGPIYHGTSDENMEKILKEGFKIFESSSKFDSKIKNGYPISNYYGGKPAPIHHLGYGVYFTTVKNIAKQYNGNKLPKHIFYLKSSNILTINFGAERTMMDWWIKNGYDIKSYENFSNHSKIELERIQATLNMTKNLASKYDAIHFKGKGFSKLLDGDQLCVFKPNKIYLIDKNLYNDYEIGSKVIYNINYEIPEKYKDRFEEDDNFVYFKGFNGTIIEKYPKNVKGIITKIRLIEPQHRHFHNGNDGFYEVKWTKGGTTMNLYKSQLIPVK